jgi:hypothetical protein
MRKAEEEDMPPEDYLFGCVKQWLELAGHREQLHLPSSKGT